MEREQAPDSATDYATHKGVGIFGGVAPGNYKYGIPGGIPCISGRIHY